MKYSVKNHKFAVIQDGYCVFGTGRTEKTAIANAAKWMEFEGKRQGEGNPTDVKNCLKNKFQHVDGDIYLEDRPEIIKQYVENQ